MNKSLVLASAAMINIALLSGGAGEGTPQTVELVKVDVQKLSGGTKEGLKMLPEFKYATG
jgi:hypothetical protein